MKPRKASLAGVATLGLLVGTDLWAEPLSPLTFHAGFEDALQAIGATGPVEPVSVTGTVQYAAGKVGRALVTGGDAAYLKYPVTGLVRPTQGTVAMWVNAEEWPPDEQAFHILFETEGPGWVVLYKFWNGGLLMLTGMDKSHYTSAFWEAGDVPRDGWHHLAGTWSRERIAFYFDGKLLRETPFPAPGTQRELPPGRWRLGEAAHQPHADR
jgi:hypothetical protein